MARDFDGEDGGVVGMRRSADRKRDFGSDEGRQKNKTEENARQGVEKKLKFGEGAVATRKAMLELYQKDKTESFEMVRAYLDWLSNAYAAGLDYKKWLDSGKKGVSQEDLDAWKLFIMDDRDLNIVYTLSSGAGGQNVQKNATAAEVTHLPTMISKRCQDERSQFQNKDKAKENLLVDLVEHIGNVSSALAPGEDLEKGIRRVFKEAIQKKTVGMERGKKTRLEQILGSKFDK